MKILFIVNEYPPEVVAGTAMSTFHLAGHLGRIGHEVHVAVTARPPGGPRVERQGRVTVHRTKTIGLQGTRSLQRLLFLLRLAVGVAPDVIQGQALSCGAMAVLIGGLLKKPVLTHVQGFDLYHASALQRRIELRTALKHSAAVLAVTEDLKARAAEISGRADIVVMPHGLELEPDLEIETENIRRQAGGGRPRRTILFVGQLHERKGLPELLSAVKMIRAGRADVRLALIGRGPLEGWLRDRVRSERLEDSVCFLGARPHRAVLAFMRLADVFVLPSREEPFGVVLIEAMSQGLPIVATEVQGIPSLVQEGFNGCLVPAGNAARLAEKIEWLLENREAAAAIGRRNREKALRFDWKRLAVRYDRIYAKLASPCRPGMI